MNTANFEIQGIEKLVKIFQEFPEKGYRRPVIAAFRKAAEPVKKAIIANLPGNLKGLRKAVKIKPGRGLSLSVGFFARQGIYRNSRGRDYDPYTIAYWHNYGTYGNRDPEHNFAKPRGRKTAGRSGGIKPLKFVERAWEQSKNEAQAAFEKKVEEEIDKFLKENAE